MKRMMHPVNGWTHVYSPTDEERHKKLGWVIDEDPMIPTVQAVEVATHVATATHVAAATPLDDPRPDAPRPVGRPRKIQ
jgi:hypothetical protein